MALSLQAQLREQTELGQKLDAAGRALGEGKVDEAQKLLLQVPPHPSSAGLYNTLGAIFARRGDWLSAITTYSISAELVPAEYIPAYALAALLVQVGDVQAYEQHRERILSRFS